MANKVIEGKFPKQRTVKHVKYFLFKGEPEEAIAGLNQFIIGLEVEKPGLFSSSKVSQFFDSTSGQLIITLAVSGCATTLSYNQPEVAPLPAADLTSAEVPVPEQNVEDK